MMNASHSPSFPSVHGAQGPRACRFLLLVLCLVAGLCQLNAAEPASADSKNPAPVDAAAPAVKTRGNLGIHSDGGLEYRGDIGRIVYKRNVQVLDPAENPTTIIRCDWLTLVNPPGGGNIQEIVAATNVVIRMLDPKGVHVARGDKAVYTPADDTVVLSGSPPILETPGQTIIGDKVMTYKRRTSKFDAPGLTQTLIRQGAALSFFEDPKKPGSTNAPSDKPSKP